MSKNKTNTGWMWKSSVGVFSGFVAGGIPPWERKHPPPATTLIGQWVRIEWKEKSP